MQNPIPSCADVLCVASHALRLALSGSGTVLNVTGTALVCIGRVLQVCGQKIRSFATANQSTPQPAV